MECQSRRPETEVERAAAAGRSEAIAFHQQAKRIDAGAAAAMVLAKSKKRRRFGLPCSLAIPLIAAGFLLGGCARYHAEPITAGRVDASLTPPAAEALEVEASQLHHPLLPPVQLRPDQGLTPDSAAVLAVLLNPALRAARDERMAASAELLQAGLLPNPQLSYSSDFVTGGDTADTFNAYGIGLSWDLRALLTHSTAVQAAARHVQAVDLDIAWQEWQTAESAKLAVYDVEALQGQLALARQIVTSLQSDAGRMQQALAQHDRTVSDVAAAEAAVVDARAAVLALEQQVAHQGMMLRRLIGVPTTASITLATDLTLPSHLEVPTASLSDDLAERRLDLVALRRGYQSQEAAIRRAILEQFPDINVGFNQASDTSNVHTAGFGVTIDVPIFDHNQGAIATERATRQRLYDEYVARVHEARSDVALATSDVEALNAQIAQAEAALPTLEDLYRVYQQAYQQGNVDALTLSAARREYDQRSLDLFKLKQQLLDNKVALELAAGVYLPDVPPATQPASRSNPTTMPAAATTAPAIQENRP